MNETLPNWHYYYYAGIVTEAILNVSSHSIIVFIGQKLEEMAQKWYSGFKNELKNSILWDMQHKLNTY